MIKRSRVQDRHGREWTISVVPKAEAEEEDFRFWYEELTPAQRVDLVTASPAPTVLMRTGLMRSKRQKIINHLMSLGRADM